MQFVLQSGLQLKHGTRVLQLVRELPDSFEFQFEDTLTKAPLVIGRSKLIDGIYKSTYQVVVSAEVADDGLIPAAKDWILDLDSLTAKQREKLEFRYDLVKAIRREKVSRGQRKQIARIVDRFCSKLELKERPSTSSVMAWLRKFENSGGNTSALVDGNRFRNSSLRIDKHVEEMMWEELRRHYFTRAKNSLDFTFTMLKRSLKKEVSIGKLTERASYISYPTLARRVKGVDLYHRICSREGPDRARMVCRTTFPDGVAEYPMQRAEIDHTPLNWIVICDRTGLPLGRPTLTLLIDAYSGYVLGFYISFYGPGVTSVCGVMRNAILPKDEIVSAAGLKNPWLSFGLVDEIVCDNGLEFHSFAFKTIGMTLGIDITYARVRTPWIKPHVERFFGSLNTLTLARGRISPSIANTLRIDPYKDACIGFADLVKGLLMYVVDVHPHTINWRKMATSYELFGEGIRMAPPAVFPGSLKELTLASGMSKMAQLDHGGIQVNSLPYASYAFKDIVRKYGPTQVLCKYDPDDIGLIHVRDPDQRTWHEAPCRWTEYADGLSLNQHKIIRKHARVRLLDPDRVESLETSRMDLHDFWQGVAKPSRSESMQAARLSGVTSARVLTPKPSSDAPKHESSPTIVLDNDFLTAQHAPIPSFESFVM